MTPSRAHRSTPSRAGFLAARGGNVGLVVALAIPAAATLALGAVDVMSVMNDRNQMRSIAETAALSGARNLAVAMSESDAVAHAEALAQGLVAEWRGAPDIEIAVTIQQLAHSEKGIRVTLSAVRESLFGNLLPPGGWRYNDHATASSLGAKPLCVLAFSDDKNKLFELTDTAEIRAPLCLVHSNGDLEVRGGRIEAGQTQAVRTATGDISPAPITDAPPIEDPFRDLDMNIAGLPCVQGGKGLDLALVDKGVHTLQPGTHCGVINMGGDAVLNLAPGEHRFVLGSLTMRGASRLVGDDVVLIFDRTWNLKFKEDAVINLVGRETGALAGFVMMADRANTNRFEIDSTRVERLDGVIYIPNAELQVSGKSDVARESDWTVVVAERLTMSGNPRLYLNADYAGSDLNAPPGVGNRREGARLID